VNYDYIRSNSTIVVKDSEYFKRLDEINQQKFEKEVDKLDKAYSYLEANDYESAAYWASEVNYFLDELRCDKLFILNISNAHLNGKKYKTNYKSLKSRCEPRYYRHTEKVMDSLNLDYKFVKSKIGLGIEVGLSLTDIPHIGGILRVNNIFLNAGIGGPLKIGTIGENNRFAGWDERSEHHVSEGNYEISYYGGIGYLTKFNLILTGRLIYIQQNQYRNSNDPNLIFGDRDGNYYKTRTNGESVDFALGAKYLIADHLYFGGDFSIEQNIFIKLGYVFH